MPKLELSPQTRDGAARPAASLGLTAVHNEMGAQLYFNMDKIPPNGVPPPQALISTVSLNHNWSASNAMGEQELKLESKRVSWPKFFCL